MTGRVLYNEIDPYAAAWLRNLIDAGELPPGRVDTRSITELSGADLEGIDELHLFAGVGGWPLALRLAGWTGPVWTGSCPCQPFSSAGKRKGHADERHLWPEMFRLVEACRPPVIFGEQVASSEVVGTSLEAAFAAAVRRGDYARANQCANRLAKAGSLGSEPRWLDGVFTDLEGLGYTCWASDLPAACVGAPQIRQRLFWVADADADGFGAAGGSLCGRRERDAQHGGGSCRLGDSRRSGPQERGCDRRVQRAAGLAPAGEAAELRSPWGDCRIIPCRDGKLRRISAQSGDEPLAARLPRGLGPALSGLGRVGIRAARSNHVGRLRGYGNSVIPQVAAAFIRAYMVRRAESGGEGEG